MRWIWIFLYLSYCKTKDVVISQYNATTRELFVLRCLFLYLIYNGLSYTYPRLFDFGFMDISYHEQLKFMLLNMGIISNSIKNLNYLSNDNVIFALDLVNAEKSINGVLSNLEIMACSFQSSQIIVLVSPYSRDHTRDIIQNWKDNIPDCDTIHRKTKPLFFSLFDNNNDINLNHNDMMIIDTNYSNNNNDRIFWKGGHIDIIAMTPRKELEAVQSMVERKHGDPEYPVDLGEYRAIFHRNLILQKALKMYQLNNNENNDKGKDYLIFVGADHMINFDVQSIATQFKIAWKEHKYDVVCANGIKYNGWYYDSFPTILADNTWFIGIGRDKTTKLIKSKQFVDANSCNSGFVAYDLKLIKDTNCKYFEQRNVENAVPSIKNFTKKYNPRLISYHVPFNYCLKERGNAKIAIASKAYTFLGVEKSRLTMMSH